MNEPTLIDEMRDTTILGLSDLPSDTDLLGMEKQCDGLVRFLRVCSTPMTIAIHGDWGTGKTSVMRQIQKKLEEENGSILWFDTWQFAVLGEQDRLLMDLLEILCNMLAKNCSQNSKNQPDEKMEKVLNSLKRIGRVTAMTGFSLVAEMMKTATGTDISQVLQNAKDEFEKLDDAEGKWQSSDYVSYAVQVSELKNDLEILIKSYLGTNRRLYIFIDDLDRLEPIRAVEMLEGIKNFLDIPQCVFVIAIDTQVVKDGLKCKYGQNINERKQNQFFDKIIQAPYKLEMHNYNLELYMKRMLKGYDETYWELYVNFMKKVGIYNPRTIKRCVNLCLLHRCMKETEETGDSDEAFKLYAIKLLELEAPELVSELLAIIIEKDEEYDEIQRQVEVLCSRNRLLKTVFSCLNDRGIAGFVAWMKEAVSPPEWVEYLPEAKRIKNIVQKIYIQNIHYVKQDWREIMIMKTHELAQKLYNVGRLNLTTEKDDMELSLRYDGQVALEISLSRLKADELFKGVHAQNEITRETRKNGMLSYEGEYITCDVVHYSIWNIEDTSEKSPIFQVLRNAGIIE